MLSPGPTAQHARRALAALVVGAAAGGALVGAAVQPGEPQYWVYLASAAAIIARWARSRAALGVGLAVVGLLGIAGGTLWSVIASALPFAVALATAIRASATRQAAHVAVVALGSFAALLAPAAARAVPMVSIVVWGLVTAALVAASHRLGPAAAQR